MMMMDDGVVVVGDGGDACACHFAPRNEITLGSQVFVATKSAQTLHPARREHGLYNRLSQKIFQRGRSGG